MRLLQRLSIAICIAFLTGGTAFAWAQFGGDVYFAHMTSALLTCF